MQFWQEEFIQKDYLLVLKYLRLFLFCQDIKNETQRKYLKTFYFGIVNWYISCLEDTKDPDMDEAINSILSKSHEYYERVKELAEYKNEWDYDSKIKKYRDKLLKKEKLSQRQYIIWNISVYLIGMINDDNFQLSYPLSRQFLYKFLCSNYPCEKANILIGILEENFYQKFDRTAVLTGKEGVRSG